MIDDGETGLLFESDNHEELAQKMLWAVDNQDVAKKLIVKAHQEVKKYRWKNTKDKLYDTYGFSS